MDAWVQKSGKGNEPKKLAEEVRIRIILRGTQKYYNSFDWPSLQIGTLNQVLVCFFFLPVNSDVIGNS